MNIKYDKKISNRMKNQIKKSRINSYYRYHINSFYPVRHFIRKKE